MCAAVGGDSETLRVYLQGYRAALSTVAMAFGISPEVLPALPVRAEAVEWKVVEA